MCSTAEQVSEADRASALQRLRRLRLAPVPGAGAPADARPDQDVAWCVPGVHSLPDRGPSRAVRALEAAVDGLQASGTTGLAADCAALLRAAERLRGLALRELA